jgi:hypothetical protein
MRFRHAFIVCLCKEMSSTFFTVPDVTHISNEHNFTLCVVKLIEKITQHEKIRCHTLITAVIHGQTQPDGLSITQITGLQR